MLGDAHGVQGVLHARVLAPKAELVDVVAQVEGEPLEGHQVVHVHRPLLERLAWRKVEVARHLRAIPRLMYAHSACRAASEYLDEKQYCTIEGRPLLQVAQWMYSNDP